MEPSLTIDDMINNPDLLLSAVNETFASDTIQQYYTPQTPSAYMPQPVQQMLQKQQSKTQVIEVLLKELNELRSRVKNLEELSQQRAQQQPLEMPSIQIPIRLDITTNDQDTSQNIGVGKATKKITACLVVNPITVGNFSFLFNCTPVGRTSDSMMVPT